MLISQKILNCQGKQQKFTRPFSFSEHNDNKEFTNFFLVRVNFMWKLLQHTVEKWKIYSHPKNISSNQLLSNFISKTVVLTKFLPKKRESKIPFFHSVHFWTNKNSVKATFLLIHHKVSCFHESFFHTVHSSVDITAC